MATPNGDIPASGNAVTFPFVTILDARDGRFVSQHLYWDNFSLMSQLGVF